tara:strand:- start:5828 stop:6658 length:831 start_codon:yes stop_codon:yes gene_type:complete
MKILIDNYSDHTNSQPLYLHEGFKKFNHSTNLFDVSTNSIFDVCDTVNPEILIISAPRISKDVIEYVQQSNLRLVIGIDNLSLENVEQLTAFMKENKIKVDFLFTSNESFSKKVNGFNIVKLYHAADVNHIEDLHFDYSIDKAIFINKKYETIGYNGTFHVIAMNDGVGHQDVDIFLPSITLRSILTKYNEIIFKDMHEVSQIFLNALCSGVKTYYDNEEDKGIQEKLNKMLKKEFNLNYKSSDKITDFKDIANIVTENHTGDNRAKTILSQIKGA